MSDHIVSAFSDELERLSADLLRMGGIVESMITDACRAIVIQDLTLASETAQRDLLVDDMEADIERRIIRLLALRQPMAADLRAVIAALKVSSNLERIGDLSKNISRRASELTGGDVEGALKGIERMGKAVRGQLNDVLDAFSNADAEAALRVWQGDEDIDQHYNSLFREVLTYMMEDPRMISSGAHMMFIAKNLERVGDHCTNIAEIVHYKVTGNTLASHTRPKAPLLND